MWLFGLFLITLVHAHVNNVPPTLPHNVSNRHNQSVLQQLQEWERLHPVNRSGGGLELACPDANPSPTVPTSAHALRPADIKVIGALGDSITAGFGEAATNVLNLLTEWRGRSWSIGGEKDLSSLVTLPSILRVFNSALTGASTGTGGPNSANAKLNTAISGAIAQGMPAQARELVKRMKADTAIDYDNDWKVVTLWIGGNDLCAVCKGEEANKPENYVGYIEEALDVLHAEMPRAFVNLVPILDVSQLYALDSFQCKLFHGVECACGTSSDAAKRAATKEAASMYQKLTREMASKSKWQTREDFTVVEQPFFIDTTIPLLPDGKPDASYFAPDCFHFSEKAHEAAAVGLWNNMLSPVGKKATQWVLDEAPKCPSRDHPFLFTPKNSKSSKQPLLGRDGHGVYRGGMAVKSPEDG